MFSEWCDERGYAPIPCTAPILADYVNWMTTRPSARTGRPYKPNSVRAAMTAIRVRHVAAGITPPDPFHAKRILAGYVERLQRANHPCARVDKVTPANPEEIGLMVAATDPSTLIGLRDCVIIVYSFVLAARASDLVPLNKTSLVFTSHGVEADVYRVKTKHRPAPVGVPYSSNPFVCPVRLLQTYRQALDEVWDGDALLPRIDRWGRVGQPLTRKGRIIGAPDGRMSEEAIADVFERAAERADLSGRFRSHSGRRGYGTTTAKEGKDLIRARRQGGWSDNSREFYEYVETANIWDSQNPLYGLL